MILISLILIAIVSYLLGSCSSAIISVRLLKHEDIRKHGSHSAGLTNVYRCFGAFPALCTLIGDLAKGVVANLISIYIIAALIPIPLDNMTIGYISGIFAIIGHIFPVYYHFKGGRGVLVSASILLVIDPLTFVIIIPFFIIMIAITRYVSVASISSAVLYPILTFFLHFYVEKITLQESLTHTILTAVTGILLIYMHKDNIKRLINHTENKFVLKKRDK
ncbi:MAG: glycerol-3-phosphate 1-O-acyltransferase PlsY [Ruminococcus sp.]|jgi:glycerol-3-phosphate acyltransferase PlsY|nr:glycerol-3-phosphate 1-O-acyltransferase PlsY [Ruminococcus sp.]